MVLFGIFHSATWRTSPRDLSAFFTKQTQILTHNTIHHILFFSFIISDHIICPHHPHDCPHGGGGGGSSGSGSSSSSSGSSSSSNTGTSNTDTTGSSTSNSNTGTSNSNTGSTNTGTAQSTYSSETGFDLYVSNGDGSYTIFEEDNYQNNTPELWYEDDDGEWTRFDLYYQNGEDEYVEYNTGNDGDGDGEDNDTPDLWYKNDEGEWTIFRTSEEYYDYSKVSNDCDTETDVDCVRDLKVNAMLADLGIGVIGLGGIAVIGALVARSVSHVLILPMDGIDVVYMI